MIHFGPFWPEETHFGPFRPANHTLAIPETGRQKGSIIFFIFGQVLVTFSDASVTFFVTFLPNSFCRTPFAAGCKIVGNSVPKTVTDFPKIVTISLKIIRKVPENKMKIPEISGAIRNESLSS